MPVIDASKICWALSATQPVSENTGNIPFPVSEMESVIKITKEHFMASHKCCIIYGYLCVLHKRIKCKSANVFCFFFTSVVTMLLAWQQLRAGRAPVFMSKLLS